jgi:hypothetical protein
VPFFNLVSKADGLRAKMERMASFLACSWEGVLCILLHSYETPAAYAAHDADAEADAIVQFQAFCLFVRAAQNRNVFPSASTTVPDIADMLQRGIGGRIEDAFESAKKHGKAAFVTFMTAGYPCSQGEWL